MRQLGQRRAGQLLDALHRTRFRHSSFRIGHRQDHPAATAPHLTSVTSANYLDYLPSRLTSSEIQAFFHTLRAPITSVCAISTTRLVNSNEQIDRFSRIRPPLVLCGPLSFRRGWCLTAAERIRARSNFVIDLTARAPLLYLPNKDRIGSDLASLLVDQCDHL